MEENIDVYALVIDQLNKNDMWFTTKADPTMENARSYYVLDEYGEPTEATIKKIVKEVESLIGDGAIDIYDAIELWINDSLIAFTIDYRNNLVTQFKDKPVVDNIEAYVNPVQFPQSKKQESKMSNMLKKMAQTPNPTYIAKCTLIDGDEEYDDEEDIKKYPNTYLLLNHKDSDGMEGTDVILEYNPMKVLWYNCDYGVEDLEIVKQVSTLDELIDFMKSVGEDLSSMRTEKGIEIGMNDMINNNLYRYVVGDNESDPELLENKKQEAKTKKTEGAGAGYHIGGIINIENINSLNVVSQGEPDKYGDVTATIDCDIDITLTEMSAYSYDYGNDINVDVSAKVTGLTVVISEDDKSNDIGVDESSIKALLDGIKFNTLIGGGWTHTTFTGGIQAEDTEITDKEYYYSYFTEIDIQISDENIIKYIDKVVEGENFYTEFLVYDKDGDIISDEFTAEETDYSAVDKAQDDAIEFAKANKGVRVVKQTYRELADGDLDNYDTEPEVVWERDYDKKYKFDDEVEESRKVERKKKQIEAFKNRKVNFNKRTKEENYQRRLDEVNNKSKNLISDMFSSNDFDSDSPAGQIVMRTSEMFNALSDKGYDVEVTFDNGESTSAIQLGQQGGKVMITVTNTNQPLRAFTSGNFEINDQNIKILQDIQSQIEVL